MGSSSRMRKRPPGRSGGDCVAAAWTRVSGEDPGAPGVRGAKSATVLSRLTIAFPLDHRFAPESVARPVGLPNVGASPALGHRLP